MHQIGTLPFVYGDNDLPPLVVPFIVRKSEIEG